jgi:glucose uptake protein GlcU
MRCNFITYAFTFKNIDSKTMKKLFLLISALLLISVNGNCQWYQKNFGVNDPSLLSQEQLSMAVKKSKDGVATGITLSVIGAIGIISGGYLFLKDYPDEKYPDQAEIGKKYEGVLLVLVSVPIEIIGLVVLKKNQSRKLEIEEFINNTEIKIGLINAVGEQVFAGSSGDFCPGFSVTIQF